MEKILLLIVMISACDAAPQDLDGKIFAFTKHTNVDRVTLTTSETNFDALTVCLRFFTDDQGAYSLFSWATPAKQNAFVIFKPGPSDTLSIHVNNLFADFPCLSLSPNKWHSLCATWDSATGVSQLLMDDKYTAFKFITRANITGTPSIILGQEQDSHGGGFDANQSFLGMIYEVNVWNSIISDTQIKHFLEKQANVAGNVVNWRSLDYGITGDVLVEDYV